MRRRARLARNSARSGRSAPDARSLRAKRARGSFQNLSGKPAPNPKSVKFSNPISAHFSKPIDTGDGDASPPPLFSVLMDRIRQHRRRTCGPS